MTESLLELLIAAIDIGMSNKPTLFPGGGEGGRKKLPAISNSNFMAYGLSCIIYVVQKI